MARRTHPERDKLQSREHRKLFHLLEKLAEVTRACDRTRALAQSPTWASIACSSAATAMVGTVTSTIPASVVVVSNMLAELMMT